MGFIADVFDVVLIDPSSGEAFGSTTMQEANLEFSMDENDIRGGKGDNLLGILHSARDISLNLTDVEFRYDWISRQLGTDIVTGAGVAWAMPKWYEATDNAGTPEITLDNTPTTTNPNIKIYDDEGTEITGFTNTDGVVDLSAATPTVTVGDRVEVRTYKYDSDADTETINFDVEKFPKGVQAILETVEIEGDETITHTIQYQLDNAVPQGNFTVSTSSSREASTQDFNMRVVKPKESTQVGRALRIPYTA